jgi:hypothetical protein
VEKILKEVPDDRVRVYVIWDPIFGGKFDEASQDLARRFQDKRVTYFKDPASLAGNLWKRVLDIQRDIAWDVYMLYSAEAEWKTDPPQPDYWMHRLWGVSNGPFFEEAKFGARLKEMLNKTEASKTIQGKNGMMKVEFLYFKSCPSHKQALENLKAALRESNTKADLVLINVESEGKAQKVGFQGSPSIRINGKDLEGRDEGFSFSCRLYQVNGKTSTAPSKEFIMERLAAYQ